MTNILKDINWRQPKYTFPAVAYFPLILVIYLLFNLFTAKPLDISTHERTEYINDKIPDANFANDGIGDKYDNMKSVFGDISDLSALDNAGEEDPDALKEKYESVLLDSERIAIEERTRQKEAARQLEEKIRQQADQALYESPTEEERLETLAKQEEQRQQELNDVLEQIRQQRELMTSDIDAAGNINEISVDETVHNVYKQSAGTSQYFNTISVTANESKLISAIIDENIKAVEGSRIRLRLLDDVDIDGRMLSEGSYVFATISGLGSQRVQAKISSILVGDEIMKVNLEIYDTDGLSGLYVPKSKFRETSKDVMSSALNNNLNFASGTGTDLTQFALQGLQNMYQQTSNAISKAIRQNTVHLKYGSQVYLVNGNNNNK